MSHEPPEPGPCRGTPALAAAGSVAFLERLAEADRVRVHLFAGGSQELDLGRATLGPVEAPRAAAGGALPEGEGAVRRGDATLRYGPRLLGAPGLEWRRGDRVHRLEVPGAPGTLLGVSKAALATWRAGELVLRALPGGEVLARFGGPGQDPVRDGAMDPAGRWLVLVRETGEDRTRLEFWDPADPTRPRASRTRERPGRLVAGPRADGAVVLLVPAPSGARLEVVGPAGPQGDGVPVATPRPVYFAWSPEGRHLFLSEHPEGDEPSRVHALDLETGATQAYAFPAAPGRSNVLHPHVLGDGSAVVVETGFSPEGEGAVRLHRLVDRGLLAARSGPGYPTLCWSGDELWAVHPAPDELWFQRVHPSSTAPPAVLADPPERRSGRILVGGDAALLEVEDGVGLRAWSLDAGEQWALPGAHSQEVLAADLAPDGERVVALLFPSELVTWQTPTAPPARQPAEADLRAVHFGPGGDGLLLQWDQRLELRRGAAPPLAFPGEPLEAGSSVEVDHEAGLVILGGAALRLWRPGAATTTRGGGPAWTNLALSEGALLSAGRSTLWLRASPTGPAVWRQGARAGALELAVDGAGARLAVLTEAGRVELVDPGTGETLRVLPAALAPDSRLAFDRDGRHLWVGSPGGGLARWDLEDPEQGPTCVAAALAVWTLGAHPEAGVLVGSDGEVRHLRPGWWGFRSQVLRRLPTGAWLAGLAPDGAAWIQPRYGQPAVRHAPGGGEGPWSPPTSGTTRVIPGPGAGGLGVLLELGEPLRWWCEDRVVTLPDPYAAAVTAAAFDDAGRLYTAAADGTVVRWG